MALFLLRRVTVRRQWKGSWHNPKKGVGGRRGRWEGERGSGGEEMAWLLWLICTHFKNTAVAQFLSIAQRCLLQGFHSQIGVPLKVVRWLQQLHITHIQAQVTREWECSFSNNSHKVSEIQSKSSSLDQVFIWNHHCGQETRGVHWFKVVCALC